VIGVVIAVRDQAQFLGQALDSLEAQTLPCGDVVVVDDASVDGSGELARERGFRTVLAEGEGPAIARNIGVRQLSTEFVRFLDGDDRFTAKGNELLLSAIGERPVVAGHVREFFDPGREPELAARHKIAAQPATGTPSSMLIRRSRLIELGGFSEIEGEHEFFGLVKALGRIDAIDDIVLERRIHGENRSITHREEIQRAYLQSARAAITRARGGATG
jgi:glycosyltransferase involved in cell wall biosynthesis